MFYMPHVFDYCWIRLHAPGIGLVLHAPSYKKNVFDYGCTAINEILIIFGLVLLSGC